MAAFAAQKLCRHAHGVTIDQPHRHAGVPDLEQRVTDDSTDSLFHPHWRAQQ